MELSTSLSSAAQVTISNATPLTITASSVSVTVGTPVPAITASYASSSFVSPDSTTTLSTATRQPICTTTYTTSSPVGTYPTSCSSAIDTNYTISYATGLVTVTAATPILTITAPSPSPTTFGSIPSGATSNGLTVTISANNAIYSGFVNGDTKSSLTGTLSCITDYTTISPPDTYITSCHGLTSNKYTINYVDGSFTVTAVAPTITWPTTAGAITYGNAQSSSALGSCSATFNGSPVTGTCAWTTPATIPHVGATQSVTWTPSGEYAADYAVTTSAITLGNVTAATLTLPGVTAPTASSIPVLSALSASKLSGGSVKFTLPATNAIVTVPGTFTWATTSVAPSVPGTSSVGVTFTPSGPNAADYNVLTNAGNATLTVTKATPTISAPTNCNSTNYAYNYGQQLSACTLSGGSAAVGSTAVTGTFAWSNPATVPAKGTINESVMFTPTAATPALYNSVTFTMPVLVNGVALTVNWPTASHITYGETLSSSNLSGGYACPTTCNSSNHVSGSFAWTPSDNAASTIRM